MKNILALLIFVVLLFSCQILFAQNFITRWNLATAGSGATQLSFGVATSGTVNYTWETIPAASSGSGTFTGSTATITGLPANATIRLSISPTNFQRIIINNGTDRNRLLEVENWGSTAWTSMEGAFSVCSNLQVTATDVPNLAGVTSLSYMFALCNSLNSPSNIGSWITTSVTNMSYMFYRAVSFNQNIGSWNTSAVTNMSGMFDSATAFNQNIGTWNTSAVTNMSGIFNNATTFNQNIGSWNTGAVKYMSAMFYGAVSFNQNIGNWNTAAAIYMNHMFGNATIFNQNIGNWNTAAVRSMSTMFYRAVSFNQNIGSWNTGAVIDMSFMFYGAVSFNQDIGNWNTLAVTFIDTGVPSTRILGMHSMFEGASAFNQNLGSWSLNPSVYMINMLNNSGMDCSNYSSTLIGWNANPITPSGRSLGAVGCQYGTNATAARTNLIESKGWTITDGGLNSGPCGAVSNTISTPSFAGTAFCVGTNVNVSFTITGTFVSGNQFNILLSDANGSFVSPQIIGTTAIAGSILCTIPANTIGGENYRIKVVSTNPVATGNSNLVALTVHPQNWNLVNPTNNVSLGISTKKAVQVINASNLISGVSVVEYKAGNAINLTAGFQVVSNTSSSFKVNIEGCN